MFSRQVFVTICGLATIGGSLLAIINQLDVLLALLGRQDPLQLSDSFRGLLGKRASQPPPQYSLRTATRMLTRFGCICNYEHMPNDEAVLRAATQCVALRARRFSRLVTRHYDQALRDVGLTAAQFTLMGAVALRQPVPPIFLARMLDLDKSTLSRNLRPLIESKFLISEARDAGGQSLSITRKGRDLLNRALPRWKKAQGEVTAQLGDKVVSRLDQMIARMSKR